MILLNKISSYSCYKPWYTLDPFGDKSESTKKGIVSNSDPGLWVKLSEKFFTEVS